MIGRERARLRAILLQVRGERFLPVVDHQQRPRFVLDHGGSRAELDRAYRLAGLLLGDAVEAEDATQEALLRAWESIASLLYGSANVADELQAALGNPALSTGLQLTGFPLVLSNTEASPPSTSTAGAGRCSAWPS